MRVIGTMRIFDIKLKNGGISTESNPKESTIIQKVSITQLVSTNIIKKSIQTKTPGGILGSD